MSNCQIPLILLLLLIAGHLTTANVFIENGVAKLSAIENFICGVPSFYRPFFVQHSKVNSMELIDVFTFGHVLFEMQSTYSLQEPYIREINDCPALLSIRDGIDGDFRLLIDFGDFRNALGAHNRKRCFKSQFSFDRSDLESQLLQRICTSF
jgi:hypothetical protein